jgi:hypothetical protein
MLQFGSFRTGRTSSSGSASPAFVEQASHGHAFAASTEALAGKCG